MSTNLVEPRAVALLHEHPTIRWGAVFAGWFVATGIATLLYVFGMAVGFSAVDPRNAVIVTGGLSSGAIVWLILSWGAALWIGAMFASWFDGRNDAEMGLVRGVAVWGVSIAATGVLMASGLGHVAAATGMPSQNAVPLDAKLEAHYMAALMWAVFGSLLLSLISAAVGGWLGSRHVHRVYHLREYAPTATRGLPDPRL